jgi:integrase
MSCAKPEPAAVPILTDEELTALIGCERLKVRADMAGLDPAKIHPHRFRHTNAHDFLLAGGQERDLKRLMGWRSDTMLERYGASAADHRAREATRRLKRGDRV